MAELGGWIAQECGDRAKALELTLQAFEYAEEAGEPTLSAMILMRRANLVAPVDPRHGAKLADRAAELVCGGAPSRLHATIARQCAHAAAFLDDRCAFERYSSQAAEFAQADPQDDELTPYAHPGYIASETAAGLILLGEAEAAATLLADQGLTPVPGQERDHAVALARWLQALVDSGDHRSAGEHTVRILMAYQRAPSQRARLALRAALDRRDGGKELRELQNHIARVLDGVTRP